LNVPSSKAISNLNQSVKGLRDAYSKVEPKCEGTLRDAYIEFGIDLVTCNWPLRKIPQYSLLVPQNPAQALFLFSLGTIVSPKRN